MTKDETPKPSRGFNISGFRYTEQYRIVPGWFGAIVQELLIYQDGRHVWVKCNHPVPLCESK